MVLILLLCFSAGGLKRMMPFQSCILARDSRGSEEMSEAQGKREVERRLRQQELKLRRMRQERQKEKAERKPEIARLRKQRRLQSEQRKKEFEKKVAEAGGIRFLAAKYALGAPEEQWRHIRSKLEKVNNLRNQANSTVGASVSGGSTDSRTEPSGPKLQWERPWKDKPLNELTEAQRLARHLRMLLKKKDTTPQVFRRKVTALRKAKSKEVEIEKQLAEARRELREGLTTRQEAVLVLKGWL